MRTVISSNRKLRLLSNFKLPAEWQRTDAWQLMPTNRFSLAELRRADLVLFDGHMGVLVRLVLAGLLLPGCRKPIVAADVVLRPPRNFLKAFVLRVLFKRIDHFIHYFRNLDGYQRFYGIGPARSSFVPFKPNLWGRHLKPLTTGEGEYVLSVGGSMRDYDTFFSAMAGLELTGAISEIAAAALDRSRMPSNIHVLKDDGSRESLATIIEGARIVALPVRPENICASGLSTYLNSMLLGKPVILTHGPGVSDLLEDEALLIPPSDPAALREAITRIWNDENLRHNLARKGQRYAESLGSEADFCARVLDVVMKWYYRQRDRTHPANL